MEDQINRMWPLAEKYLTLGMLSENLPGAFLIYRAAGEGEILFASIGLVQLFECDSMEDFIRFTGGCFDTLVYPEDIEKVNRAVWDQVSVSGGFDYVRYRVITKTGKIKIVDDWGHLVHNQELNEDIFYVYLQDIQVRNELNSISSVEDARERDNEPSIEERRDLDELTGLVNMRAFRLRARDELEKIFDEGRNAYCLYFNVRNFHTYNETYGFAGGDRMLKSIARILQETFSEGLVARFLQDHFAVITAQEDLRERIGRMGVRINNIRRGVIVEMKAGVYAVKDRNADISTICDHARLACDSIKREYGTTVQFYDGRMDERARLRERIQETFQSAMDRGEIKVYYQPVVDVTTKQTVSLEALTRWEDPEYGVLSPAQFIDVLEEFRQIHLLDTFVIREVCAETRRRIEAREPVAPVSINLSRFDFDLTDIVKVIEDLVEEFKVDKDLLRFEITESLIATDPDALRQETERLREHGFKVWMDAFGGGYSSFKMLKDFPLDGLKIDMDMVHSLNDSKANAIVATVIALAKRLGIPALSKGVETEEQLAFLKESGCDLAQGYLFGKPAPAR
ncbi:MAG: GGDEF domain-containing protein [Synergistaceae bacterium]|nr:GGDEF domain-containing protein [Synergistaceae bacterium]